MTFKEWAYECPACGAKPKVLHWDYEQPGPCACGGSLLPYSSALARNRGVIDDQIEGGPRFFEHMGNEPVWIESKSQWKRELESRGLVNVVKHDSAHYAKQLKMRNECIKDTGYTPDGVRVR